jgi:hypothetical protein
MDLKTILLMFKPLLAQLVDVVAIPALNKVMDEASASIDDEAQKKIVADLLPALEAAIKAEVDLQVAKLVAAL